MTQSPGDSAASRPLPAGSGRWVTGGVVGIIVATFFSDVGHEMATETLPMYLASIGYGAAALGIMEGFATSS